eukprot:m.136718 g.136718  ORF g.136718 m.136718 type:complete len:303 (+) comp17581_c0_seq1:2969-3877(+)
MLAAWNVGNPAWTPSHAQPPRRALPVASPAVFGLTLPSTNTTSVHDTSSAMHANRHVSVLAGRGMGLLGMVVSEVRPPVSAKNADPDKRADANTPTPGSILVCGLALVKRIGLEPVADLMALNLVEYSTMTPSGGSSIPGRFAPGEVISWGTNYASEKGVALSPTNGLLIAPCPFSATCQLGNLGERACGRTVGGPYTFSFMGHTVDLHPANTSGWAVVSLHTSATTVRLLHTPATPSAAVPWVTLALLDGAFRVYHTVQCLSNRTVTVCSLPRFEPGQAEAHVECRIRAPKTTLFREVHFA